MREARLALARRGRRLWREELCAVADLRGRTGDRAAAWDALARRQPRTRLDVIDEQIERALGMRLDQLELRKRSFERLDVIAILHFIQSIGGLAVVVSVVAIAAVTVL